MMTLAAGLKTIKSISNDPAVELLRELLAQVRGLREDLRKTPSDLTPFLSRADRARLARLLPPIGGVFGSEPFLARDVFESDSPALRLVRRGLNAKRIGRLFRRAKGRAVDGYVVEHAGVELNTWLWRVLQVPGFLGDRNPVVPPPTRRGLV